MSILYSGSFHSVAVNGDVGYAVGEAGLVVLDLTDKTAIEKVSELDLAYEFNDADIVGSDKTLFITGHEVTSGKGGLISVDVTDDSSPSIAYTSDLGRDPQKLVLSGTNLFVGRDRRECVVFDVSDSTSLKELAEIDTFGVESISYDDVTKRFYAADSRKILVFDATDVTSTKRIAEFETEYRLQEVVIHNGHVFTLDTLTVEGSSLFAIKDMETGI